MKGLDGIQGPVYVGTGCVFNRQALYGYGPLSLPTMPKTSSSSCSWCGSCCRGKKSVKEKNFSEVHRDAKREDLNAAIFNLREILERSKVMTSMRGLENFWLIFGFYRVSIDGKRRSSRIG